MQSIQTLSGTAHHKHTRKLFLFDADADYDDKFFCWKHLAEPRESFYRFIKIFVIFLPKFLFDLWLF